MNISYKEILKYLVKLDSKDSFWKARFFPIESPYKTFLQFLPENCWWVSQNNKSKCWALLRSATCGKQSTALVVHIAFFFYKTPKVSTIGLLHTKLYIPIKVFLKMIPLLANNLFFAKQLLSFALGKRNKSSTSRNVQKCIKTWYF